MPAWLHNLDPVILRLTDDLAIRWYGVAYVVGFALGWLLLHRLAAMRKIPLSTQDVADAIMAVVIGVIVGGRVGYVLFYQPSLLWTVQPSLPWWGLLAINRGGMASHGGIIGVVAACWYVSRKLTRAAPNAPPVPFLHIADLMALASPIGLGLGRIANFINGELLGKVAAMPGEPAPWWAVKFPQEVLSGHDPAKLLSSEARNARAQALHAIVDQVRLPTQDFADGYARLLHEIQHGSNALASQLEPLISARHPSQLYQAFTDGAVLLGAVWIARARTRRVGVVSAVWLMVYGVGRIITEFFRLPDADLAVQRWLGFSRGQWLSVGVIALGFVVLWLARRSTPEHRDRTAPPLPSR